MLNQERAPLLSRGEKRLFERAAQSNNHLLQTSLLMDAQIVAAQRRAYYQLDGQLPDFQEEIFDLTNQAHDAITKEGSDQAPRTDYYRLISQTALLEQRLKAPFVFEKPQHWKERAELVNGLYGINAQIVDEAIKEFDTPGIGRVKNAELRGVIQEQTFMALFNHKQQRQHIAVPSATCADMYKKTDVDIWTMHDKQTDPFYLPVQIKSSAWCDDGQSTPENGVTIFGHEYNNVRHLNISRLIVRDHRYMIGVGQALSPIDNQRLELAEAKLFAALEQKAQRAI
jgi:hypothetical protein